MTGALYSGTELAPQIYREAHLIERLQASGREVIDEGDVDIPHYLPRHNVPPIRNWPAPRIVWEHVAQRVQPLLHSGHIPLLVGGDCSVVVGTTQAMIRAYGKNIHVLCVDGHIDAASPQAEHCRGAAAMGLWMITHVSPFWDGPVIDASQMTVLGWSDENEASETGIALISLSELREAGLRHMVQQALQAIDAGASILLHFDIDVLDEHVMPAAYSPNPRGLQYMEVQQLLSIVLADPRVRAIEVTEYFPLRDLTQTSMKTLVNLLTAVMPVSPIANK